VNVDRHRSAIAKPDLLTGANPHRRTIPGGLAFATPNGDYSFVVIGIDIETIIARLQHRERLVGRVHFIFFVVV
jgi:hypothetical protein